MNESRNGTRYKSIPAPFLLQVSEEQYSQLPTPPHAVVNGADSKTDLPRGQVSFYQQGFKTGLL